MDRQQLAPVEHTASGIGYNECARDPKWLWQQVKCIAFPNHEWVQDFLIDWIDRHGGAGAPPHCIFSASGQKTTEANKQSGVQITIRPSLNPLVTASVRLDAPSFASIELT